MYCDEEAEKEQTVYNVVLQMSNKKLKTVFIVLAVVVFIIILILSAGLWSPDLKTEDSEQKKQAEEEEEKLRKLEKEKAVKALREELEGIEEQIKYCEEKFEKIKGQEKTLLFYCRLGIGLLIIALDFLYSYFLHLQPREIMGELLKFNSALVSSYAFVAFISHGTPAKFATYLKSKIKAILRWWHRSTYTRYETLRANRQLSLEIIEALERPIEETVKPEKETIKV